jgi:hypothetical protein
MGNLYEEKQWLSYRSYSLVPLGLYLNTNTEWWITVSVHCLHGNGSAVICWLDIDILIQGSLSIK